jgi:hypothetical protein
MRAKTYKSTNKFIAPQSLSTFGIEITVGKKRKYLGLEEFNFCDIIKDFKFKDNHIAYIPCFQSKRVGVFKEIKLFYLNKTNETIHYATLYNVKQIDEKKSTLIPQIREELIRTGFDQYVENSYEFRENYEALFDSALSEWKQNFFTNRIIAKNGQRRFVVNAFYESVEFHNDNNKVPWSNLKFASKLFND